MRYRALVRSCAGLRQIGAFCPPARSRSRTGTRGLAQHFPRSGPLSGQMVVLVVELELAEAEAAATDAPIQLFAHPLALGDPAVERAADRQDGVCTEERRVGE